jgi:hypothetical protein
LTAGCIKHYKGSIMGFCGSSVSSQEKAAQAKQAGLMDQLTQQAQQLMGNASKVFQSLIGSFTPTILAGPNQEGYGPEQMSALKSGAITSTAIAGRNAMTAVKQAQAAVGGGNMALPGGAAIGAEMGAANTVAQQGAAEQLQIEEQSKELGYQKYKDAAGVLSGSMNVFNPATQAGQVAVGAGQASAQTAEDITKVQNQPGWGVGLLNSLVAAGGTLGGAALCPAEGSMYLMADGSEKAVENLVVGEKLRGIDGESQTIEEIQTGYTDIIRVITENGLVTRNSPSHAFALPKGGFTVSAKSIGKTIVTANGPSVVIDIKRAGIAKVYNVITDGSHTYQADGVWALGVGDAERQVSMNTWSRIGGSLLHKIELAHEVA